MCEVISSELLRSEQPGGHPHPVLTHVSTTTLSYHQDSPSIYMLYFVPKYYTNAHGDIGCCLYTAVLLLWEVWYSSTEMCYGFHSSLSLAESQIVGFKPDSYTSSAHPPVRKSAFGPLIQFTSIKQTSRNPRVVD